MARQFLASNQNESDIIEPTDLPSGMIIVAFFGTMVANEKWVVEQADADADPTTATWVAVHRTDSVGAIRAEDLLKWGGIRDLNRVLEVPVSKGYRYRARKVFSTAPGTITQNATVTATYSDASTKRWI